jgi:hypothetical protein
MCKDRSAKALRRIPLLCMGNQLKGLRQEEQKRMDLKTLGIQISR